jgi:hypothetical protein
MTKKPRKKIEIYFILYLAALILLLPGKEDFVDEAEEQTGDFGGMSFSLQPEKTALFCAMEVDSTGLAIMSIDSVNTIYYQGKYENVRFEFTIEDRSANQRFRLSSRRNPSARFFRIEELPDQKAANFYWKPPDNIYTNKSYLVEVRAIAEPLPSNPRVTEPIVSETKFSLNIYFRSGRFFPEQYVLRGDTLYMASDSAAMPPGRDTDRPSMGDFTIVPEEQNLKVIAYQRWKNLIHAYGINLESDLATMPEVEYELSHPDNGGTAEIAEYTKNAVIVTGIAPSFGTMKVNVRIIRRDGREAATEFNVLPQSVGAPDYARVMYPGREYNIDPNLPLLSGQQTRAALVGDNKVRAVSPEGHAFEFTPSIVDTGKVLYLELYVNDSLFDMRYPIQVNNYPPPEILRLRKTGDNSVRIKTRSYGLHYGSENYIEELRVSGNARARELFGLLETDKEDLVYNQYFEIKAKDEDKPFRFMVRAIDKRGKSSHTREYSVNR